MEVIGPDTPDPFDRYRPGAERAADEKRKQMAAQARHRERIALLTEEFAARMRAANLSGALGRPVTLSSGSGRGVTCWSFASEPGLPGTSVSLDGVWWASVPRGGAYGSRVYFELAPVDLATRTDLDADVVGRRLAEHLALHESGEPPASAVAAAAACADTSDRRKHSDPVARAVAEQAAQVRAAVGVFLEHAPPAEQYVLFEWSSTTSFDPPQTFDQKLVLRRDERFELRGTYGGASEPEHVKTRGLPFRLEDRAQDALLRGPVPSGDEAHQVRIVHATTEWLIGTMARVLERLDWLRADEEANAAAAEALARAQTLADAAAVVSHNVERLTPEACQDAWLRLRESIGLAATHDIVQVAPRVPPFSLRAGRIRWSEASREPGWFGSIAAASGSSGLRGLDASGTLYRVVHNDGWLGASASAPPGATPATYTNYVLTDRGRPVDIQPRPGTEGKRVAEGMTIAPLPTQATIAIVRDFGQLFRALDSYTP